MNFFRQSVKAQTDSADSQSIRSDFSAKSAFSLNSVFASPKLSSSLEVLLQLNCYPPRGAPGASIKTWANVERDELRPNDFIIAVMGPTGVGKSTFISSAVNRNFGVGSGLRSFTNRVSAIRISFEDNINVVLVDTPGFDDTLLSDLDILKLISDWLRRRGGIPFQLTGLLYLHRISDNRMKGTHLKNLNMFQKLCGKNRYDKVILMTTMWSQVESEEGRLREEDLKKNYWATMIEKGSDVHRFDNTQESALEVISELLAGRKQYIQVQRELHAAWKEVPDTAAGKELYGTIASLARRQQDILRQLQLEAMKTEDQQALAALLQEYTELSERREGTLRDMKTLDPSFFRRIYRWARKEQMPFPYQDRCEALILGLAEEQSWQDGVDKLDANDAALMADFIDKLLHEKSASSLDAHKILPLLDGLITKAGRYPSRFYFADDRVSAIPAGLLEGTYNATSVRVEAVANSCLKPAVKEILISMYSLHANILPLYKFFPCHENWTYLIFPKQRTLRDYLDSEKPSLETRMRLVLDVIDGLSCLHQLGVVHGGLRTENVYVSDNGRCLISSFNLVTRVDSLTSSLSPCGAPEVRTKSKAYEGDVWSFSCLWYEVLVVEDPIQACWDLTFGLETGSLPSRPSYIEEAVWAMMTKCWHLDPAQRPSCEDLQHFLSSRCTLELESASSIKGTGSIRQKSPYAASSADIDYEKIYNITLSLLRID